jgi:hypothetical protein
VMDPDEALKNAREALKDYSEFQSVKGTLEADRLAEAFEALDQWMRRGGFPPKDWDHKCGAPHPGLNTYERITCLMKPGHGGPHRHFTDTSSASWT